MQTAINETKTTGATLAEREKDTARAKRALEDAQRDEATAGDAYALEMSEPRMTAWRAATEKREQAAKQLEAHEKRERRARDAHETAVREEMRAELAQAERDADVDTAMKKLAAGAAAFALEVDRLGAQKIASDRAIVRAQQAAAARARALAEKLDVATAVDEVHLDDARVLANVAIGRRRVAESRDAARGIEVFIEPIYAARERCTEDQFTRASELLALMEAP